MPQAKKPYTIGIDVGGTKMNAVLFDGKKVIADSLLATPKDDLDHFLVMLKAVVDPLLERARENKVKVAGIGLGAPSVMGEGNRKVLNAPNLQIITGVELPAIAEEKFDLPVRMDNDANCYLSAEARVGAGARLENVYGITLGTGIGSAWRRKGELYSGSFGGGGEICRLIVDYKQEMYLEDAYHKLTQNNPATLAEEAFRGDVLADKIFEEIGRMLGCAFANIANLLEPEAIIVGGGVMESSELFMKEAKKAMRRNINSPVARKKIRILKSKLGKNAGAIGAALLVER